MRACWLARKENPGLIVQHGTQWPNIQPVEPISLFDGYGTDDVSPFLQRADMMANRDGRRWPAARVLDDRAADWFSESASLFCAGDYVCQSRMPGLRAE